MIRQVINVVDYVYLRARQISLPCLSCLSCCFCDNEPNRQDYISMTKVTHMPQTNIQSASVKDASVYTVFTESIYSPSTSPSPFGESFISLTSSPSPPL